MFDVRKIFQDRDCGMHAILTFTGVSETVVGAIQEDWEYLYSALIPPSLPGAFHFSSGSG